jgi:hypothetical protein
MTLLTVVQDVCAAVGVMMPSSIFSNITGNRTAQEMLALANEMAQRIAYDNRDWTAFKVVNTYNGDGVKTQFPLPANYKRMLLTSNVWRSTQTLYPMRFIPDLDEWLNRRTRNYFSPAGEWTIVGGNMLIYPTLDVGMSVYFPYADKNCINLSSGGRGDRFASDSDTFALSERLLKLGMTWQWKAQKGSPYSEDIGTYGDALSFEQAKDSPSPIIIGRRPLTDSARTAYPFPVPTP